jgi:glycosyltransferase involved in cell wall biosynthesis
MIIVMKISIISDCAFVGMNIHEVLKEQGYHSKYLPRSRGIFDKTFGIFFKILASRADIFHVNYALQDAFLVDLLKHLDVLHCHGSDLRWEINKKWSSMIKHNLQKAKKVLVSTPDILNTAKKYNETAEYIPNPINTDLFKPKQNSRMDGSELVFIYANVYNEETKGTETFLKKFNKIKKDNWTLKFIQNIPHESMPSIYYSGDVVVGEFKLGILQNVQLEGMACGKPVISNINKNWYKEEMPAIDLESMSDLDDENIRKYYGKKGRKYVVNNHERSKIVDRIIPFYEELLRK